MWDHWLVWNIPSVVSRHFRRGGSSSVVPSQRTGTRREVGWVSQNPPDREHPYRFVLYALDTTLDRSPAAVKTTCTTRPAATSWKKHN